MKAILNSQWGFFFLVLALSLLAAAIIWATVLNGRLTGGIG
ncbi:MAG: hypothetical protein M0Z94_14390 [Dehalococcoidales bacterium]|nr:hypothetical protein [Dehalococcoidales bacterium]